MNNLTPSPFLRLVAKDLLKRFGTNMAELTVVFPSRRARLFFNQYLYEEVNHPLWSPQYLSIEELFESVSPFRKADPIQLSGELYQSYISCPLSSPSKGLDGNFRHIEGEARGNPTSLPVREEKGVETLDDFFFFGEILLNDFDDIDKNLVNARILFDNLKDLGVLKDDFSHLSDNQREALAHFRNIFMPDSKDGECPVSTLKTSFLSIWNILGDVYHNFKENLRSQGTAY